jgi:stress-induced morphogen
MAIEAAEIERLIKQGIPDAKVEITDLAGDDNHFAAVVISEQFAGKSKLQQHQLVYKALGGNMGGALHALQLQTSAPK